MNPSSDVLFSSDLWQRALERYASDTHLSVKLFDADEGIVFGPIHSTPLFQLFEERGYDPGIFRECARRCLAQAESRPAVMVSETYGLAVVGTSLVLEGKIVGAAVAGYAFVDFSQLSEVQRLAKDAGIEFEQLWRVAREQKPVPQQRLVLNGELLQVLGDALLRENSRTRQHEEAALNLEEAVRAKDQAHQELQQIASALRESEGHYRLLFDLGPVAVYSCNVAGVIQEFNFRAAELWGRTPVPGDTDERFCGSYKLFRPDGSFMPHAQCPMAEVVSGKISEARDAEVLIERPDGSRVTVIVNIRPLKNERGDIIGAINCFYDITERKQAAEALRGKEERFRMLADNMSQLAWTCDLLGNVTWYNQRWYDYTGTTFEEMKDWGWKKVQHPDHVDRVVQRVQHSRETGEIWEDTFPLRSKSGEYRWFLSRAVPIREKSGEIIRWFGTNTDITEQREAEDALQRAHDELESLVQLRTASLRRLSSHLQHVQDDERRRIARELHDSAGQYLAALKMNLAQLEQSGLTKAKAGVLAESNQLLDRCLAEIRTMSYLLHPPMLDESGLGAATAWYVEGFAKRSSIRANLDISPRLERLPADAEMVLFRVLQESLTNVHRHSQSPKVDVRIGFENGQAALTVRDYGRGFRPEQLENIRSGMSVGVGLAGMRERVNELGGIFEVFAEKPGTSVKVILPVAKTNALTTPAMESLTKRGSAA